MKRKRILFIAAVIAILLIGVTGALAAYLTAKKGIVNQFTIGQNETEITEEFPDPPPVNPGDSLTKKVSVQNKNSVPCYIRVSISYSNGDIANGISLDKLDHTNWVYIEESENEKLGGYYYYKKSVAPSEKTTTLFEGVSFTDDIDASLLPEGETFDIIVYEESVAKGSYTSYQDAWEAFLRE